jgi:hypothetical protein
MPNCLSTEPTVNHLFLTVDDIANIKPLSGMILQTTNRLIIVMVNELASRKV